MRILFILFVSLCSCNLGFGQLNSLGLPYSVYYSSLDYEGGIQNLDIEQNKEGFLYFANNFGLLEYDGNEWNTYPLPFGTKCRDIFINQDGYIYVAGQADFGYFIPDEHSGRLSFISLADSLPKADRNFDEAWKIYAKNGHVYFCTFNDIYAFKNNRYDFTIENLYEPDNYLLTENELFVSLKNKGLYKIKNDKLELFNSNISRFAERLTGIINLDHNSYLISSLKNGIFHMKYGEIRKWKPETESIFQNTSINGIKRLNNGDIAVATQDAGLILLNANGDLKLHLNKGKGLESRTVLALYQDLYGNLWLGHNNGISVIEINMPFNYLNEQFGLPGTGYDALPVNNKLYLGTNTGLYTLYGSTIELITNSNGQVYSLNNIQNKVLVGHDNGPFLVRNNTLEKLSNHLGVWNFIPSNRNRNYILSGEYKGISLYEFKNSTIEFKKKIKGFNESSRIIESTDTPGVYWMTHGYKGAYKLKFNNKYELIESKRYNQKDGFPSQQFINVWKVANELIFSTESGIYQYNASTDSFKPSTYYNNMLGENVQIISLVEDAVGNILYISTDEIGYIKIKSNGSFTKISGPLNRIKPFLNDDLQNIISIGPGSFLIAAKEGFIHFSESNMNTIDYTYRNIIKEVNLLNQDRDILYTGRSIENGKVQFRQSSVPEISYKNNSLSFQFVAPFIGGNSQFHYKVWLENYEEKPNKWTVLQRKEYTNLPEGSYTFHVSSKNVYGYESQEATYDFIVLPPWYRSKLAYFFYVVGFIILGYLSFLTIRVFFRKRSAEITEEKDKEITRIDEELRNRQAELERLKNERLKDEIEQKNKELASSTMHLINKNGFIHSIKSTLNSLQKRNHDQEIQKEINKVIKNIDKNIDDSDDWELFSVHFDKVHGDFSKRLQKAYPTLSPQDMKLSAYLRMNLSTKEIAHLLNISIRGVEIARYRLRKKLELERSDNLQEFILKY